MLSDPIIATLEKIVSLHDGIAEPAGEHILNAIPVNEIVKLLAGEGFSSLFPYL